MWFRYDLRVEDNQALFAALDNQVCLPIFILDEGFLKLQTTSDFHLSFLKDSLENLNYNLKKKFNTKLNLYEGKTIEILNHLIGKFKINNSIKKKLEISISFVSFSEITSLKKMMLSIVINRASTIIILIYIYVDNLFLTLKI